MTALGMTALGLMVLPAATPPVQPLLSVRRSCPCCSRRPEFWLWQSSARAKAGDASYLFM